jgi:hypothetical protein
MSSKKESAAPQTQPPRESDTILRLQIGVGGVLAVLLLVGLAGIISSRAVDQAAEPSASGAGAATAPATSDQPLVDLGVQPATPDAAAPPPAAAAPAQGQGTVTDLPAEPARAPAR